VTEEGELFGPVDPPAEAAEAKPDHKLPPGKDEARRRVARLLAANRRGRPRDPEGMGADTWRPWP
jgi:hypothetical protein